MKLVFFGLTISSSWGNGHATLWRGLIRALARQGCEVVFFERDVSYYAETRDLTALEGAHLVLYPDWASVSARAAAEVRDADAAMVTSYCPDALPAATLARSAALSVFYDLDTPITLAQVASGDRVPYLPLEGLGGFDLVLSYTGGRALDALRGRLGARRAEPLYGHVDPEAHHPAACNEAYRADLSYMGAYAADRQPALERLFLEPARRRRGQRFVLAGAGYPQDFPWSDNGWFLRQLAPGVHPAFFSSSRLTLNVTRRDMARWGWCPSGRLFEAAACATPVLSDAWEGLDSFFEPGREILIADGAAAATAALDLDSEEVRRLGRAARARVLRDHTSDHRARELLGLLEDAGRPARRQAVRS
ncbi:MAG: glycosyltransferase [Gemmatimonadetes bacterium]|nr:glycosyltransferase [Gemmatimonadota bacterium]